MSYEFLPHDNFLGLDDEHSTLSRAGVVVLPVPYEVTVSYGQGTRRGPRAIISASQQVELYDREFRDEPALSWGVHTTRSLAPDYQSPEATMQAISNAVSRYLKMGKLVCVLGGEHAVSGGVAAGIARQHPEFVTVQLDAHADLRDTYEGTMHSHACAARRILDAKSGPIMQLGIRSLSSEEAQFSIMNPDQVRIFFAEEVHAGLHLQALEDFVRNKMVYLTIDIDCLDAALMPATGTPEPNGLSWDQVLMIVRTIAGASRHVAAFDVVELAPIPGNHAPDYLAAKLVYKVMSILMSKQV